MERAERIGLSVAVVGHVVLLILLSLSLSLAKIPRTQLSDPMDVQFVDKVGLTSAAPKVSQEAPAPSVAPEKGVPEDSNPPPPKAEPVPEPKPLPRPVPPKPTPAPPKPQPKPEPKPEPKPVPKPTPAKPDKAKPDKQQAKPAPEKAKPAPEKPVKKSGLSSDFLKDLPQDKPGNAKPKGSRLGADFLKGLSPSKSPGKASAPRAAAISAQSMAGIAALIREQVKPNYNPPSGGVDVGGIVTTLHITMAKDGSVSGVEVVGHPSGGGSAYVKQADDAAIRAIRRSSPLHLPPELYAGGWQDITLNFRPDQMQ